MLDMHIYNHLHSLSDHAVGSALHPNKSSHHRLHSSNNVSDLSNDSSPDQGYPDFPPSPDSWLGDSGSTNNTSINNNNNSANSTNNNNNSGSGPTSNSNAASAVAAAAAAAAANNATATPGVHY